MSSRQMHIYLPYLQESGIPWREIFEDKNTVYMGFSGGISSKEPSCQCRRWKRHGFNPRLGRSPGGQHDNPLQYSCLENLMDRGAWWAIVYKVTKNGTRLKQLVMQACIQYIYSHYSERIQQRSEYKSMYKWIKQRILDHYVMKRLGGKTRRG